MTTELAMTLSYIGGFIAIALIALWTIYTYQITKMYSHCMKERDQIKKYLNTGKTKEAIELLSEEYRRKNIVDIVFEAVELQTEDEADRIESVDNQ